VKYVAVTRSYLAISRSPVVYSEAENSNPIYFNILFEFGQDDVHLSITVRRLPYFFDNFVWEVQADRGAERSDLIAFPSPAGM
jgi:hypothetical protein